MHKEQTIFLILSKNVLLHKLVTDTELSGFPFSEITFSMLFSLQ